jgi:hypothetical protein
MHPPYKAIFDLTGQPDLIRPAYWFFAIFVSAGMVLSVLAWLAVRRRWRWRRSLPLFAGLWIVFSCYMIALDIRDTAAIRTAVTNRSFQVVEGCLDYFRPGSPAGTKSTAGNEEWSVASLVFNYGAGEVRPAYHKVSTAGGAVRPDSRVRVTFVISPAYARREIVKLEVAPQACPPARAVEMFSRP